ncbi:hypothetical protein PSD17_58910 [Pseudonocardia sp. D17]|nr:hypothetical protein PSD17_58910 [Pseudonocardia sp. D17]
MRRQHTPERNLAVVAAGSGSSRVAAGLRGATSRSRIGRGGAVGLRSEGPGREAGVVSAALQPRGSAVLFRAGRGV